MKRYAIIAAAGILAAACGSKTPTTPSNTQPTTIVFTAALSSQNEIPVITNADVNGRGTGTFTLNLTRDASGTITAATGTFVYNLSGFPAGTLIRATHIHEGGPAIGSGGVVIDSGLTAATGITLADGTLTGQTFSNRDVTATLAQQIIANPNGYYFNVHSGVNPGGAVRAQLVKQ